MKLLVTLLLVFLCTYSKSEVSIVFDLQYCLDNSTHIFQGKVISEVGLLQIDKTIKGEDTPITLEIDGFENLKNYVGYVPEEIKGWELLIFLNRSEKGEWLPMDISDIPDDSDFELVLSILWIKDDEYYSGIESPDYYGPVVFGNWAASKEFKVYIYEYVQLQKEIKNIKQLKSCRKKINALIRLYDSTEIKELIFQGMKETDCNRHWRKWLENIVLKDKFDFEQRRAIEGYIVIGRPKVIDHIFYTEFDFWKNLTTDNDKAKWWIYKEPYGKRFVYFKTIIYTIAGNEKKGWREKCEEVIAFFSQLPNYNADNNTEKIHKSLQRYYLN